MEIHVSEIGTLRNPAPAESAPVEPKVKWAGIGFYVAGVVALALVNAFTGDDNALVFETVPDVAEPFVLPLVPVVAGMISAWSARHQWRVRPDASGGAPGSTEVG